MTPKLSETLTNNFHQLFGTVDFNTTAEIDFSSLIIPDFFMKSRDDTSISDYRFPRELELTPTTGLLKELIRWVNFRVGDDKIIPSNKGDITFVARKAAYHWLLKSNFRHGQYLLANEVDDLVDKCYGWTGVIFNGTVQLKNDHFLINQISDLRWSVAYTGY